MDLVWGDDAESGSQVRSRQWKVDLISLAGTVNQDVPYANVLERTVMQMFAFV